MNYHVILQMEKAKNEWMDLGQEFVFPWDTRDLIEASSGWVVVNEQNYGFANDLVSELEKGILELMRNKDFYMQYEVLHGIGAIRDTLQFYRDLLKACREYPYAHVYGSVNS